MKRWIWDLYQEKNKKYEYEIYIMKYDQREYKSSIVTIVYPHHYSNSNSWTGYYVH